MQVLPLKFYTHLGAIKNIHPLGEGNINDTYLIETRSKQKYVLQKINTSIFKNATYLIDNHLHIQTHLKNSAYPFEIPFLIPNDDAQFLTKNEDASWRIFAFCATPSFSRTSFSFPKKNKNTEAYQTAFAYGLFDAFLEKIPVLEIHETIPNFHNTPARWIVFESAIQRNSADRAGQVQTEIMALRQWKPSFETIFKLIEKGDLPLQIIHNDAKLDNILVDAKTGNPIAIIDWDTIMPGCLLADFGDLVRSMAPNEREDFHDLNQLTLDKFIINELKNGFLDGYFYNKEGFEVEKAKLGTYLNLAPAWIIGEQALRFLTDYLLGDVYYKIQYAEHNLVRARNQLRLLALIE